MQAVTLRMDGLSMQNGSALSTNRWSTLRHALGAISAISLLAPLSAASAQLTIERWLVLGPAPAAAPFGNARTDSALMATWRLSPNAGWPADGTPAPVPNGTTMRWKAGDAAATPETMLHAAAYISSDRWQRASLAVAGADRGGRRLWLDGKRVTGDSVTLTRGKHFLLVQRLTRAGSAAAPLTVTLTPATPGGSLAASLDPRHAPTWKELNAIQTVSDVALDPSGSRVALVMRTQDAEGDRVTSWLEVRDAAAARTGTGGGKLLAELRAGGPSSPAWSTDGKLLAFAVATDRSETPGRDLWIWDATTAASRRLLRAESIDDIVGWSPDGEWIYYTGRERASAPNPPKPGEMRRLTEVWQRGGFSEEKVHLYAASLSQGIRTTLVGDSAVGVAGAALSPDGKTIVFSRSVSNAEARPWLKAELWALDVATLATRRLLELTRQSFSAPGSFAFSPDSRAVAFCASAKELEEREDPAFNVYESELYATSLDRPALVHLSAGFAPSVGAGLGCSRLVWSAKDGRLYAPVDAGARTLLARTARPVTSALEKTTLETVPMTAETMSAFDVRAGVMVAAVEGPTTPPVVQRIDLATGAAAVVAAPNDSALAANAMPTWKPWSFRNTRGEDIEAWYWLPPAFDSTAKHPMIVHYYGGTLPMKKNFEKRLLWFAANGYVVLMMNPAGAPGYGQKFSNYHANDWGFPAASDIIEGTEKFVAAHRYVDGARVGNFGHSYGGFMTMHLHTRTPIFRTGISLAGISNIANYWGAGNSGYSYTDGTCPGCYPWNRKDIYVDRSPLFSAEKIKAPMLLIHGTSDDNVVPTESEQMFTALRMLGREAELVRVQGENHGINSRPSVEEGRDSAMLDWFDKYLRDQPAAWAARWKP